MQDSSVGLDGIQIEVAENNSVEEESEYEVEEGSEEEMEEEQTSTEGDGDRPDMELAINKHPKRLLQVEKQTKKKKGYVEKKVRSPQKEGVGKA